MLVFLILRLVFQYDADSCSLWQLTEVESRPFSLGKTHKMKRLTFDTNVQGGTEPTDTFQMVIDNIWKQEKNKRNRL